MGLSHSDIQNQDLFKQFKRQEWRREIDLGLYELWQNTTTGELCEAYKLEYIPREQDLEHYRFRHYNQNADNFVEICYVDVQKKQSLCNHGQSYVLTEFIPIKLSEMNGLTLIEAYSILRAAYRAFHTMEAFHGPFIPDEELIGINLNGKPKIWLNKNHSKNKADRIITAEIWEKHMGEVSQNVKKIVEMVEQKLRDKRFPNQFREYFYDNVINFLQASEFVQLFCEKERIIIPYTIQYTKYLKDAEIIKIVNEYNNRVKPAPFNDKLNTIGLPDQSHQFKQLTREESSKTLKRNESHQNFTYHQNPSIPVQISNGLYNQRPVERINTNNARSNTVVFSSLQKTAISPVPQGSGAFQIVIPPYKFRPPFEHPKQAGPFSSRGGIQPSTELRNPDNALSTLIPRQPQRIVNFQNMRTPMHVANQITFVPPNKIAEFQQLVRTEAQQVEPIHQEHLQKSLNKQHSIHEKIKDIQDESINEANGLSMQQTHQHYLNENQTPKQSSSYHNQELQPYINNHSHYQNSQLQEDDNRTSEPDWQNLQHQKQFPENQHHAHQLSEGQHYQYQKQSQHQYRQSDISPIKQSKQRNIEEFQNHIALLAHYANPNHQHKEQFQNYNTDVVNSSKPRNISLNESNEFEAEQQDQHYQIPIQQNERNDQSMRQHQGHDLESSQRMRHMSSKNTSINRGAHGQSSGTLVIHESRENLYQGVNQQRTDKIIITNIQQESQESENDEQFVEENHTGEKYQVQGQQYYHNNQREEDQFENNQQMQQHRQHNNNEERYHEEQYYQNRPKTEEYDEHERQYEENNVSDEQRDRQFEQRKNHEQSENQHDEDQNQQYSDQNKRHLDQNQQYSDQNQEYQNQNQQYRRDKALQFHHTNTENQNVIQQYQEGQLSHRSVNRSSQQINQQQQQIKIKNNKQALQPQTQPQNQYDNLHFRNQSDELYQYTPVESVYRRESGQHYHYGALPRPHHSSGVEEIVKIQTHQDIENYIRNKYSDIIKPSTQIKNQPFHRKRSSKQYNRAMTFAKPSESDRNQVVTNEYEAEQDHFLGAEQQRVQKIQSLYERIDNGYHLNLEKKTSVDNPSNGDASDFLDVGNLQKSLDKKYKNVSDPKHYHLQSPKHAQSIKRSQTMSEQDGMNVAALEQRLQKFEERQSIERQKSQRKLQTYNEELSSRNNNELNFNELDNIVELMDKKIQESQKKQRESYKQLREQNVSQYSRRLENANLLDDVELETSINNINNKELSLKDIPILGKDQTSNGSNSIAPSKRDYVNHYHYGFDSEDFATGRGSSSHDFNPLARNQNYNSNKISNTSKNFEKKYDILSPVTEIQKKYQSYSSRNLQSFNNYLPTISVDSYRQLKDYERNPSRRSTKNNEDAKRLAEKISNKYDKYMNGETTSNDTEKPFAKKSYYESGASFDSSKNMTGGYQNYTSKYNTKQESSNYQTFTRINQRKRSTYLNTIQEMNGQNNVSPYRDQMNLKNNPIPIIGNPLQSQSNRQNVSKLSNQSSRIGSKKNIAENKPGKSSKVSYDELRDLLWK